MKLPRTTLILILLALALGGFVYFHEIQGATQQAENQDKQPQLFAFTADDVQSLTVKNQNYALNLERNNQSEKPKWLIKSPISAPANDAIVSYLLDLLVKGNNNNTLSTSDNQLGEFGLDQPQATISINLKNQQRHQLILGRPDYNKRFLYAQVDPAAKPNGNINLLLVSTDFGNAVNRELSEWKQPEINIEPKPTPISPQPTPTTSK
ncbi:hypothetical protein Cylst_1537 [Cylindrospermum stagnale PCC 7417]|uniref:DUF4340 domain-containing protein n=1 Tax=Cylindrospermum stagnale PCC 7417 TaxID=56107 RepID=K9WVK5_9NOST|nr:DUF4340 domain-containing protein [Cylindrospermum stagnale]AFZ23821.1 hypothetical protein Cylst_1537 [Cylindrospermum stagnale PCC 7417]